MNPTHRMRNRSAFVCGTPLQLISCVSMTYAGQECGDCRSGDRPDLFFRHDFLGSDAVADRLRGSGLFGRFFDIRCASGEFFSRTAADYLPVDNPVELLRAQTGEGAPETLDGQRLVGYDRILCSYPYDTARALCAVNPAAELIAFEDGVGSYVGNIMEQNGSSGMPSVDRLYLWSPELYRGTLCTEVRRISLVDDPDLGLLLDKLFDITEDDFAPYIGKRFIYLTQPRDGKEGREREAESSLRALSLVREQAVIRRHPRDNSPAVAGFAYDERNAPWELACLHGVIDDDSVLIASVSTAQLMPKQLLQREPWLIFTAKLSGEPVGEAEAGVIEMIRDAYRDKSRLLLPENEEDLARMLSGLHDLRNR